MRAFTPMSPLLVESIPHGEEWIHQLKWDGYRILAWVEDGQVSLFSKKMLPKNRNFPDLVDALSQKSGKFLLDGEAVVLDAGTGQPSFQLMQQRDKLTDPTQISRSAARHPVLYMIFDLLELGETDLREASYVKRREQLQQLTAKWEPPLYLAEEFEDGETLWNWVVQQGWEGIVSKKKASVYKEAKAHRDWLKVKTILHYDIEIIGVIWKAGRVSSLVMRKNGRYFGRVSSGLNEKAKRSLMRLPAEADQSHYFGELPEGLKNAVIRWLNKPLEGRVAGRETTEQGLLRHPRVIELGGIPL